jgi:hypothetical protein
MYIRLSERHGTLEFTIFRKQCFFLFSANPRNNINYSLNDNIQLVFMTTMQWFVRGKEWIFKKYLINSVILELMIIIEIVLCI